MKKIIVLILLFSFVNTAYSTVLDLEWVITGTNVKYFSPDDPGDTNYYITHTLCSYSYSSGKWTQDFKSLKRPGAETPEYTPSWIYSGYFNGGDLWWDGSLSNPSENAQAETAREFNKNEYLLDYLNEAWPNGGSGDPNFGSIVLAKVSDWQPELPQKPPYENSTQTTQGADPVFLSNGEYKLSVTDLSIQGRVLSINIVRTYGSRREYNSRFGYGWDLNYNMKVRRLSDANTVILLDGDGYRREYLKNGTDPNKYERTNDLSDYFYLENNTFALVEKSGIKYNFDPNGNLSSIVDKNGNSITFTYNSTGLMPLYGHTKYFYKEEYGGPVNKYGLVAKEYELQTITDDLGRNISFTYNSNGLLSTITDFASRTWTYTYNPNTNDLISVEDPNGNIIEYAYDGGHNLENITDVNNQTYIINSYYLPYDKVDLQTYGNGNYVFAYYDPNKAVLTDREGFVTQMIYSESGQVLNETIYTKNPNKDPNSFITDYFYNSNLELVRQILPLGNCIDYTYNENSDVNGVYRKVGITDPNNINDPNVIATLYTYDSNHIHDINSLTDPRGSITAFDYDTNGNVKKITHPAISVYGQSGNHHPIIGYTYNEHGQVETITAADGIVTKYVYYNDSNPADPNCGKLWKVVVDANQSDPNRLEITTEYKYDIYGNIKEIKDPNGDAATFQYNELNLLTKTITPLDYVTKYKYNKNKKLKEIEREKPDQNQVTSYTYDILDHLKSVKDPCNYETIYGYDKNEDPNITIDAEDNDTVSVYKERGLLESVTDANGNTTYYTYNENGDINDINDAKGHITRYYYDGFGRLESIVYPDGNEESLGYDKNSNITIKVNRNGDAILYEFDALNRMAVKNRPDDPNIYFSYDIAGRVREVNDLRSVSNGGGITTFAYDRIGRVEEVNDINNRLVSYEYDSRSLRTKLTYPDNDSNVTYEYDSMSRLTKVKYNGSTVAEYEYDELSRRKLLTLGNDANAVYDYDIADKLKKLTNNVNDVNITFTYAKYDKVGNRKSMQINDANSWLFNYDNLYQLIFVDYNDGNNTDYYYDALGNRTRMDDGSVTSYASNSLNQYTAVGGTSYIYDDNGNLTDDGTYLYYYDIENRLTDVNYKSTNNPKASYEYDYKGRRIKKTVYGTPNVITKYCYDGDQIIAEYDGSDNLLRKFVYGPGIDEPICMINVSGSTETKYYYHFDGLGSVVALSDVNSGIIERYSYDIYGEPNRVSSVGNPYMFTGRQYDSETDNYYYRARYYKPSIGRFLQTDPIGYEDSMNLYQYCLNNPISFIDPFGLEISVQTHYVALECYHTSIRITPVNQKAYVNNPNFKYTDSKGKRYATLGAGPENDVLVSEINRKKDRNLSIKVENLPIDLKGKNEDDVIKELFTRDKNYPDNLPYEYFPTEKDNFYNSNSYTKGILEAANLDVPKSKYKVPGYNKPVPKKYFQCKGQN